MRSGDEKCVCGGWFRSKIGEGNKECKRGMSLYLYMTPVFINYECFLTHYPFYFSSHTASASYHLFHLYSCHIFRFGGRESRVRGTEGELLTGFHIIIHDTLYMTHDSWYIAVCFLSSISDSICIFHGLSHSDYLYGLHTIFVLKNSEQFAI